MRRASVTPEQFAAAKAMSSHVKRWHLPEGATRPVFEERLPLSREEAKRLHDYMNREIDNSRERGPVDGRLVG